MKLRPNERNVVIAYDPKGERFRRLHDDGAKTFGRYWLSINDSIAQAAMPSIDLSDPAAKELLSLIAMRVLVRMESMKLITGNREGKPTSGSAG